MTAQSIAEPAGERLFSPGPLPFEEGEGESLIWRGFIVTCNFFYETPTSIIAIFVTAVAATFIYLPLAIGCYLLAGSSLIGRVIVKITSTFGSKPFERLEEWILGAKKRFPYLHQIAVIASIAICTLFPPVGGIAVIAAGCYSGMLFEIEHSKCLQEVDREKADVEERGVAFDLVAL